MNGKHLDEREATRALEQAYDAFDDALKENGANLNQAGTDIDTTTQKGRDLQDKLDAIAKSALDSGQAIVDAGGGYDQYRASLEASKAQIDQRIADLGITGAAAQSLSDLILKIPTKAEFTAIAHTEDASAKLDSLRQKYLAVGGLIMNQSGLDALEKAAAGKPNPFKLADAGKVFAYAGGGSYGGGMLSGRLSERHEAQFSRAGDIRIWSEPETGGEYYIPVAQAKRQRSTSILEQVADEFGYDLVPQSGRAFSGGGRFGGKSAKSATSDRPVNVTQHIYPSQGMDEEALADKAIKKLTERL